MKAANLVSISRVLMVPIILVVYYAPLSWSNYLAAAIFAVASLTDWLDGYLARRLNQVSPFGAFLDPVADKLLVVMTLVLLVANFPSAWFVLPVAVIIAREVFVSALREWMASCNQRDAVKVGYLGKVKTTVQMIAIIILLGVGSSTPDFGVYTGYALIYVSAIFSLWSMTEYLKSALPILTRN
jgi:CDP-diacylglycerol---glycerol-3-phosphate 3-phosphatidyltransferase